MTTRSKSFKLPKITYEAEPVSKAEVIAYDSLFSDELECVVCNAKMKKLNSRFKDCCSTSCARDFYN